MIEILKISEPHKREFFKKYKKAKKLKQESFYFYDQKINIEFAEHIINHYF